MNIKDPHHNKAKTKTDHQEIKSDTHVDRLLTLLFAIGAILVGVFGTEQLHFLMVLFVFLTISVVLFDYFRHTTFKGRWYSFTFLAATIFLLCGLWEIHHSKPSFLFASHKSKTLLDLFKSDFPSLLKAGEDRLLTTKNNQQITVPSQAWLDFESQTIFIGFYIPDTPQTFAICAHLADNYKTDLDLTKKVMVEQSGAGMQPVNTSELKFSGRVFLYHETPLLEEQRRELFNLYKSKGLSPQFRDYQYVADVNKR